MKITCKKLETPPVFQPRQLVIDIESEAEMGLLVNVFGHDCTVARALTELGVIPNDQADACREMLRDIYQELMRVRS